MPDIRTLLEETTARRSPHTDPVGAVHATVRRRAARRRTAVAAVATVAVGGAATLAVARGPERGAGVVTAPTAAPRTWDGSPGPEELRFTAYVKDRPDRFAFFGVVGVEGPSVAFSVGIGGDADEDALRAELDAAAQGVPWRLVRCPLPLATYDRIRAEAAAPGWPSGAPLQYPPTLTGRPPAHCTVEVAMPYIGARDDDRAYAQDRWGDAVTVLNIARGEGEGTRPVPRDAEPIDPGLAALGALAEAHPEAFVGVYVDGDRAVVVLGSGAYVSDWGRRIRDAADGLMERVDQCQWTRAELEAVQDALPTFDWPSGRAPAFGAAVDPRTCSVLVQTGDLPDDDEAALRDAFGKKITIDQSGAPQRR